MHLRKFLICTVLFYVLLGCSGSSDSTNIIVSVDPSGEWRVEFVNLIDGCELLPADEDRFTDDQEILLNQDLVTLNSSELPLGEYEGSFRSENSFVTRTALTGDIFNIGFSCSLEEAIAFNNLTNVNADVVYEVKIICDDGSRCDTAARGRATRS